MKKRFLCVLLASVTALSMAGCGGAADPGGLSPYPPPQEPVGDNPIGVVRPVDQPEEPGRLIVDTDVCPTCV